MRENERTSAAVTSATWDRCPNCESSRIHVATEEDQFTYGDKRAVTLSVRVPMWTCDECGFKFSDRAAGQLRHDAVCRHLGVMTPAEILELRKHYGMSRFDFSRLTRIGEASLARWENGLLIQNQAYDQYLRLLKIATNIDLLRNRERDTISVSTEAAVDSPKQSRKFRALTDVPSRVPFSLRTTAA